MTSQRQLHTLADKERANVRKVIQGAHAKGMPWSVIGHSIGVDTEVLLAILNDDNVALPEPVLSNLSGIAMLGEVMEMETENPPFSFAEGRGEQTFKVAVVTAGTDITKTWKKDAEGRPIKQGGGVITGGTIATFKVDVQAYVALALNLSPTQCVLPCNMLFERGTKLTTKRKLVQAQKSDPSSEVEFIARSKDYMRFEEGEQGVVVLDHDPSKYRPEEQVIDDPRHMVETLARLFPDVFVLPGERDEATGRQDPGTGWGGYASSGSYIYDGKTEVRGLNGHHTALGVMDASDIPRFADALFDRLWLHGYGHIDISRAGSKLERAIVDVATLQPQQPIFTTVAVADGLEQRRPAPTVVPGMLLDTTKLKSLSFEERQQVLELKMAAKDAIEPEAQKMRAQYTRAETKRLVEQAKQRGEKLTEKRARSIVERRLTGDLLPANRIYLDEGYALITVADILADPLKFNGKTCADPSEPEYGAGPGQIGWGKAIIWANLDTGRPLIYSHAHGGRLYWLRYDRVSIETRLKAMEDKEEILETWCDLVLDAALDPAETESVVQVVKEKTGRTKKVLEQMLSGTKRARKAMEPERSIGPADELAQVVYEDIFDGRNIIATKDRSFWSYTGTHWERIEDVLIENLLQTKAREIWFNLCMAAESPGDLPKLDTVVPKARAILERMTALPGDPMRLLGEAPAVVNCSNGEVWLTGSEPELRPHRAQSYLLSCNAIKYDPAATCPSWDYMVRSMFAPAGTRALEDLTEDQQKELDDIARHVEEMLGYVIQPSRFLKVFYILMGQGDNGKSKIPEILQHIVGEDALSFMRLDSKMEDKPFVLVRLLGKLGLVDDDADNDMLVPDGLLKRISERKTVEAQFKYKDQFSYVATVVVMILSNSWPRTSDLSRGMATRAQVLKFERSFLRPDECAENHPDRQKPDLVRRVMTDELPGVLNRLLAGFYRVRERNGFLTPTRFVKAADEWLEHANSLASFVAEEMVPESGAVTGINDIFHAYEQWCLRERIPVSKRKQRRNMKEGLEKLGYTVGHFIASEASAVRGLRLRTADDGYGRNGSVRAAAGKAGAGAPKPKPAKVNGSGSDGDGDGDAVPPKFWHPSEMELKAWDAEMEQRSRDQHDLGLDF